MCDIECFWRWNVSWYGDFMELLMFLDIFWKKLKVKSIVGIEEKGCMLYIIDL